MSDAVPGCKIYRLQGGVRYTRISCRPFGALHRLDKLVQAEDRADAVRQASLCVARDLEEIVASVNSINVSDVRLEVVRLSESEETHPLWNLSYFAKERLAPRHVAVAETVAGEKA